MKLDDEQLGRDLRAAQRRAEGSAPSFETVWARAEARQNRRPLTAAAAVIVAAVAVVVLSQSWQAETTRFVDVEELVASTTWVAPSDHLLPAHRFDIFQDLPEIPVSTGIDKGTLL